MPSADRTRNVMQINRTLGKASAVMDAFATVAKSAGIDLRHDSDGIETALIDFFTDRDSRDESSARIRAGA